MRVASNPLAVQSLTETIDKTFSIGWGLYASGQSTEDVVTYRVAPANGGYQVRVSRVSHVTGGGPADESALGIFEGCPLTACVGIPLRPTRPRHPVARPGVNH